jgi:hypothetical protein
MEKRLQGLPEWTFDVEEVSAGVYSIKGEDRVTGANLHLTGIDPDALLLQAAQQAAEMKRPRTGH